MMDEAVGMDVVEGMFDYERVVSDAGTAPVATLVERLGVEAVVGRLTRTARQWTLHLPARWPWPRWPWQHDFIRALARIRALPAAT